MQHKILWIVIIIISLIAIYSLLWLFDPTRQQARLRVTGFNSHFTTNPTTSFAAYIADTIKNIKLARTKANADPTPEVIAENSPRILYPDANTCPRPADGKYENGILLIHGLLDSPYTMDVLGQFFQKKCFVVYIVVLTGHGTVPGDLLAVKTADWETLVHFAIDKLSTEVKNNYLMGYSLGGLLAINASLDNPNHFKGLILFGPALGLKTQYSAFIPALYWLSRLIPQLQWIEIHKDLINVRYESFPTNAVYQTYKLLKKVQDKLANQPLNLPIFMQQSADDMTVDPQTNLNFFTHNTNPHSKLLWYATTQENNLDPRIKTIPAAVPALKILDISHLAYLMPADDKIYGLNGSYKDCMVYAPTSTQRQQCMSGQDTFLGEITPENLAIHTIQRLTFNPFQQELFNNLSAFIDSL